MKLNLKEIEKTKILQVHGLVDAPKAPAVNMETGEIVEETKPKKKAKKTLQ